MYSPLYRSIWCVSPIIVINSNNWIAISMKLCRDATNKHEGLVHALRCKCKRKYKCRYKQRPYFQRKRQDDRYAGTAQDFFTEPWWHLRLRCVGPLTRVQCTNILTHTVQMDMQGSEHFTISCLGAYSCVCICVKLVHTCISFPWTRSKSTQNENWMKALPGHSGPAGYVPWGSYSNSAPLHSLLPL